MITLLVLPHRYSWVTNTQPKQTRHPSARFKHAMAHPTIGTLENIYLDDYFSIDIYVIREGVQMKKTFLNGHCPDRSYPPPPRGATSNVVLIFGRQKRHLGAYYRIKF